MFIVVFKIFAMVVYGIAIVCAVFALFTMLGTPDRALAFGLIPYALARAVALIVNELEGLEHLGKIERGEISQ